LSRHHTALRSSLPSDNITQAQKTRKKVFHFANQRNQLEKTVHDGVQRALVARLGEIKTLKDDLQEQLAHVEAEIIKARKVKKKLDSAIVEKLPPLNLAQSRYATRTKKPVREAIHDDVETSLLQQYQQIKAVVVDLQHKQMTVDSHIQSLERTRQELKANIQDKIECFKLEQKVHQMAGSRPPTGVTINSHALSLRPTTGSTLGGLTMSRPLAQMPSMSQATLSTL